MPKQFCDVKFKGLLNTLHHSLAVVKAKKPGDTMRDVEAEALVDRLAEVKSGKKKKICLTMTDM